MPVRRTLRVVRRYWRVALRRARRATAPAWFSAALMDEICKPSTVFGAFNAYGGPKTIDVFPFNNHEGGGAESAARVLRVLHDVFTA